MAVVAAQREAVAGRLVWMWLCRVKSQLLPMPFPARWAAAGSEGHHTMTQESLSCPGALRRRESGKHHVPSRFQVPIPMCRGRERQCLDDSRVW